MASGIARIVRDRTDEVVDRGTRLIEIEIQRAAKPEDVRVAGTLDKQFLTERECIVEFCLELQQSHVDQPNAERRSLRQQFNHLRTGSRLISGFKEQFNESFTQFGRMLRPAVKCLLIRADRFQKLAAGFMGAGFKLPTQWIVR